MYNLSVYFETLGRHSNISIEEFSQIDAISIFSIKSDDECLAPHINDEFFLSINGNELEFTKPQIAENKDLDQKDLSRICGDIRRAFVEEYDSQKFALHFS